jgi:Transcriptional regulators
MDRWPVDEFNARDVTRLRLTILRLARRIRRNEASRFSPPQQSVLAILDSYGPMTPGRLAEIEAVQPPSITRILGQLEQLGVVTREPVKANLRQVQVRLTDEGRRAAAEVHSGRDEWLATMIEGLPRDRKASLIDLVETLEMMLEESPVEMTS